MFEIVVQNTVVGHKVAAFDESLFVYNPFTLHIMLMFSVKVGSKTQTSTQILYSLKLTN